MTAPPLTNAGPLPLAYAFIDWLLWYSPDWGKRHKLVRLGIVACVALTPPGHVVAFLLVMRGLFGWGRPVYPADPNPPRF